METAKVDIRRLQVLNDCINRTIEALNQVRLSVHAGGLQHSAPIGVSGYVQAPYLASPLASMGIPAAYGPAAAYGVPGLGHTAAAYYPQYAAAALAASAYGQPFAAQVPFASPSAAWASPSAWTTPSAWATQGLGGLGHSALGSTDWDPYTQSRISHTFPFVHWGYSPFGWPSV
jgi:hypothetical protein